jgi:hypothetical protein
MSNAITVWELIGMLTAQDPNALVYTILHPDDPDSDLLICKVTGITDHGAAYTETSNRISLDLSL